MSDIRERIASVLRTNNVGLLHAEQLTDLLMSLPDVAIVAVPKGVSKDVIDNFVITAAFLASDKAPPQS